MRISDWSSDVCSSDLRDAAALDVDQAMAAMAQAQAQAANSLAAREQARVALAANFPEIPLPIEPPETSVAMVPAQRLAAMRDLDRKSTRLNSITNAQLVCRLRLEKKKIHTHKL